MPTRWETFPVELRGGLVSNVSRLQQGLTQPGSARELVNFEPSIKGGYRRINGYTKFDSAIVPPYGDVRVQGSGHTGTTLEVANLHEEPEAGDTFTIAGVSGTYTIASGGVTYSSSGLSATLTLTSSLASSPGDQAVVTFTTGTSRIEGLYYSSRVYALRGGSIWKSEGAGWTLVSTPTYGVVLVAGAGQTGTTLNVDGIVSDSYTPRSGDTFTIAGVDKVYTVTADSTATSGAATLTITPALNSSPADNSALTFLQSTHSGGTRARFEEFNFDGTLKVCMVDGANEPAVFTDSTYSKIQASSDVKGASFVTEFKDHLFFGKSALVTYSVPFDENDFNTGGGAGSYRLDGPCTGLIVFREQLINFTESTISKLTGSSSSDFAKTSVAEDIGCDHGDTIQEVGGDIVFLSADGVRFLGATERIGDFNLSLATRQIQDNIEDFTNNSTEFSSLVIRKKNQYRIFGYTLATQDKNAEGFIGTQFIEQSGQSFSWSETKGLNAYLAYSTYQNDSEVAIFSNNSGYVYSMESGNDFDGTDIDAFFYTPYASINDPRIRKTSYKVTTYVDPENTTSGTLSIRYDFDDPNKIQPQSQTFNLGGAFSRYGEAVYGTNTFGGKPQTFFTNNVTGSFFTVSFLYEFTGGAPFVLDTILLEYSTEDRI